ncbi:WecB/TagA/CpsF family glycosyltransferase [Virgibacillus dakarensis]|uniref:N-acetylglucosaminyldiphosphoundecaprenol N-acetyl-beta-D-mannosaminyltransferase n=1 Tax=Lentibacillus populi TaxID=1827502 RepID=A0A9W5X449_9BACI|nr:MULTISPECIES: WecB/TagA/CpsF family glycosyltransferase [Bacillaceae]MBT2216752.1 WecB/TagA/CpsF family glycosyltransferase [Virgibacillus dakarensis]MTW87082.1 WecB/TagA/CpsF family glycosyltransferase [Virgibacillus dakarensis]GGB32343.1 acetylglucosaminyldiphosphoundecaprenol acetyl-beta-D-mannosaminyltransferase [Lentibacillus populi]
MTKANDSVTIMDIPFLNTTKDDFLHQYLFPRLADQKKSFVVTANPEIVMRAKEDTTYKEIIQSANYVIPDGSGILMAAKYKNEPLQERIPGYDLMLDLLKHAEEKGYSCYFLGAKESVNEKVVKEVNRQYPGLKIAGHHHGFFAIDDPEMAATVKTANPDLIFVALGVPRQEMWIAKHKDQFAKGLFIGIGGSFDIIAGETKRAPQLWINLNLEWLYRLIKQPTRFKRILKVFEFMGRVILRRD